MDDLSFEEDESDYKELKAMHDSELWRTGAAVRELRPENMGKVSDKK